MSWIALAPLGAAATTKKYPRLDAFGRSLLDALDPALAGVGALVFVLIVALVIWKRRGRAPTERELVHGAIAVLGIPTALTVLAVLVLTDPPAVDATSRTTLMTAGTVATIYLSIKSISAIWPLLFGKDPPNQE